AFALEPGDRLDGGRMGNAEAARDVGRPRLAGAGQEVGDELDIVLEQRGRLRGARLAEAARLRQLRRQLGRRPCDGTGPFGLQALGHRFTPSGWGGSCDMRPPHVPAPPCPRQSHIATSKSNCSQCYIMYVDIRVRLPILECSQGYKLAQVLHGDDEQTHDARAYAETGVETDDADRADRAGDARGAGRPARRAHPRASPSWARP